MTQLSSLARRICYHYPNVAPAAILSAEPVDDEDVSNLRAEASHNGVCYLEVTRAFHDGTYLARVAAHPDLIRIQSYTVVLSAAQLAQARPSDCRTQSTAA
jgi:hypothetical protein